MFNISADTKIYLMCPHDAKTGGPEAIHQLHHCLLSYGLDSNIAYITFEKKLFKNPFTFYQKSTFDYYDRYKPRSVSHIEDNPNNILIVPETWTAYLSYFKSIQTCIWWLSVDNHLTCGHRFDFDNQQTHHLYQSTYAQHYLIQQKANHIYPIFDYIQINNQTTSTKEDIICYSPRKGFEVTEKILARLSPSLTFIPLIDMTTQEISDTLSRSKIYIDFGFHPGKDRLPREAALLNNIIITSNQGAAFFYKDYPFPDDYKFYVFDIDSICQKIELSLNDYSSLLQDFSLYKSTILQQKEEFFTQTKELFT